MGWPCGWTSLEPISYIEYKKWLRGFNEEADVLEKVSDVRKHNDSQEISVREIGRQYSLEEEKTLQSFMRKHKERIIKIGMALAGKEISEDELRSLWNQEPSSSASYRRELPKHEREKPSNALHLVSQVYPCYGREAWKNGTWEAAVPRVATGIKDRVNRLKAIGNGQVPQCMAKAVQILSKGESGTGDQ